MSLANAHRVAAATSESVSYGSYAQEQQAHRQRLTPLQHHSLKHPTPTTTTKLEADMLCSAEQQPSHPLHCSDRQPQTQPSPAPFSISNVATAAPSGRAAPVTTASPPKPSSSSSTQPQSPPVLLTPPPPPIRTHANAMAAAFAATVPGLSPPPSPDTTVTAAAAAAATTTTVKWAVATTTTTSPSTPKPPLHSALVLLQPSPPLSPPRTPSSSPPSSSAGLSGETGRGGTRGGLGGGGRGDRHFDYSPPASPPPQSPLLRPDGILLHRTSLSSSSSSDSSTGTIRTPGQQQLSSPWNCLDFLDGPSVGTAAPPPTPTMPTTITTTAAAAAASTAPTTPTTPTSRPTTGEGREQSGDSCRGSEEGGTPVRRDASLALAKKQLPPGAAAMVMAALQRRRSNSAAYRVQCAACGRCKPERSRFCCSWPPVHLVLFGATGGGGWRERRRERMRGLREE